MHKCLLKYLCVPVCCMMAIEYISLMYMGKWASHQKM